MGVGSLLTFESPALDEPKTEGGQHPIPDYPGCWRFAPASYASDPSATGNLPLTCATIPPSRSGSTANRLEIALETPFLGTMLHKGHDLRSRRRSAARRRCNRQCTWTKSPWSKNKPDGTGVSLNERDPFRTALFNRGHRLAGHPGEGGDLLSEGYCLGCEAPMFQRVPIPLGRATTGPMHPADAMSPNGWRTALEPAPLRSGAASQRLVHRQLHGVEPPFFCAPPPPRPAR